LVKDRRESLRALPSVEVVVDGLEKSGAAPGMPRQVMVNATREALAEIRQGILEGRMSGPPGEEAVLTLVLRRLAESRLRGIQRVINATGVIVHTNLGRSLLAEEARRAVNEVVSSYASLELDLITGKRTSRTAHVGDLLSGIIGCEDALVVNNNAAAVMLALNTHCNGREAVVSRGELVEIGGSFRLPEIIVKSGAKLVEVGTTNRTRIEDYAAAVTEETGAVLKVHQSNFMMWGFVESVACADLAQLARDRGVMLIDDLGSGALYDFSLMGIEREPMPQDSLKSGADLVTFSGDKLMGGPQAGIIVGRHDLVDECRTNPMARALRVDRVTLAALQATLMLYHEPERLAERLPTLSMISAPVSGIRKRAEAAAAAIGKKAPGAADVSVAEDESRIGGGALPGSSLPTYAVVISPRRMSADDLVLELRKCRVPVIARISEGNVLLDFRTVRPSEDDTLIELVNGALARIGEQERS
jgi:L-seryl-tRNA(Ser) seleniumtransferase